MKLPLSWLREYVEVDLPVPELARRLIDATAEVEGWETIGGDWDRELVATELLEKYLISASAITDPARVRSQAEMVRVAQEAGRAAVKLVEDRVRAAPPVPSVAGDKPKQKAKTPAPAQAKAKKTAPKAEAEAVDGWSSTTTNH